MKVGVVLGVAFDRSDRRSSRAKVTAVPSAQRQPVVVLVVVPGQAELVVVVPDRWRRRRSRCRCGGRDVEGVERVADHGDVAEAREQLALGPDPLGEARAHVVEGHAPVGAGKERVGAGHPAHAGQREVPGAQLERRVELVARVAGGGRRQGGAGDVDQDVEVQPPVEGEARRNRRRPGSAGCRGAAGPRCSPPQVVGVGLVDVLRLLVYLNCETCLSLSRNGCGLGSGVDTSTNPSS